MSEDNDNAIIMLIPIFIGVEDDSVTPGSAQIRADCGHECWIAPSSLKLISSGRHKSYITRCAGCLTPEDIEGIARAQITSDAYKELVRDAGDGAAFLALLALASGAMRKWQVDIKERMIKKGLLEA